MAEKNLDDFVAEKNLDDFEVRTATVQLAPAAPGEVRPPVDWKLGFTMFCERRLRLCEVAILRVVTGHACFSAPKGLRINNHGHAVQTA